MQYIVGLVYLVLLILPFLEQSVFSSVLRNICLAKVCEKFMEITGLEHIPNASGITFIAFMVCKIHKSQGDTSAQCEVSNRFCCALFSTKLTVESRGVFYNKVVGNFITFPTVEITTSLDLQNESYSCFTALLIFCLRKISDFLFLPIHKSIIGMIECLEAS
jgi:hypothetical protein